MTLTLDTDMQYLKGVGEKRAALYVKLGVKTVRDLLYHFPRDYVDLSSPFRIMDAPLYEKSAIKAVLVRKSPEQRIRAGLSVFKLLAEDETGRIEITMFNTKYTVERLELDREYIFYGRIGGTMLNREISSPSIYPVPDKNAILPVYPQTSGITSGLMRTNISQALTSLPDIPDALSDGIREKYSLPGWKESINNIHFPKDLKQAALARERFIFEELLALCCALSLLRSGNDDASCTPMSLREMDSFFSALPFRPTNAQLRSINEAMADMCSGNAMNRLVQGDVGSGKTLVAAACAYFAYLNGYQTAVMAPTSILAEQHLSTFTRLLEPLCVKTALLTGSTGASLKKEIYGGLSDGSIQLCVGTHALLSGGVEFDHLGLVVTDEQHRFGVSQRKSLTGKGENPHVLVMSATPIPRTLSLIVYGDLKLSVIDELPPGRQSIDTFLINGAKRKRAVDFLRKALDMGRQAYIVCPLIEAGENSDGLRPAREYAEYLSKAELKGYKVSLLHGRMKPKEKEDIMRRFSLGEIQVLVSTTVVEVGVDVPNATIILIENAERFGLSQLHQLRGRVGRGNEKSYCILISDANGEAARGRLRMMRDCQDGFRLAEYDMQSRGPGDFFGHRQHGLPDLKVASLSDNLETMRLAKECSLEILKEDPSLSSPEYSAIGVLARDMLAAVGDRPN